MAENILWFLLFGALFYFMMKKGGCGMHAHGGHDHGGDHSGDEHGAGEASHGEARDPVCGRTVAPDAVSGVSRHEGRSYAFCSAQCQQTFLADPQRYARRIHS